MVDRYTLVAGHYVPEHAWRQHMDVFFVDDMRKFDIKPLISVPVRQRAYQHGIVNDDGDAAFAEQGAVFFGGVVASF